LIKKRYDFPLESPRANSAMNSAALSVLPWVLVTSCHRRIGLTPVMAAGTTYVEAVRLAGCRPLLVPSAGSGDLDALLDLADGILLTGSASNVHPSHFGETVRDPQLPLDEDRDAWTLPLIRAAVERGVPMLAICRGCQEFNVAFGGSLHQAVHEVPGFFDHRAAEEEPLARKFGPAHEIGIVPGGLLDGLLDGCRVTVNSVHGQGIDRLAPRLRAEASAPDGLIEAVSVPDAQAFNLGVQWHPEWQAATNPVSLRLLEGFGAACRTRRGQKEATARRDP
jgi:putative glutamine amidotransferase